MKAGSASRLLELEASKLNYGAGSAAKIEKLLASMRDAQFDSAESLIRFHDLLLFLCAFPQSRKIAQLADDLLTGIVHEVERFQASGADMELFDNEEFSGIAGTTISDNFTYDVARWLAQRYPQQLSVEWNFEEQGRQMAVTLPRFIPLLGDDSLVEADTPFPDWMANASGGAEKILPWLLQRVAAAPLTSLERTSLYDSLAVTVSWKLGNFVASRTHARRRLARMFYQRQPLLRRNQVSLADEMSSPPLPVRKLSRRQGEDVLDLTRTALTLRYRELYGTTRGDPNQVFEAEVGRGVQIFLWGLPPERRLPLRAYHAGLTVKNGVPINYIEGISLFDWMEVGFNTFYAFRDGETAWIYSKVLHFLHQLTRVTCFSVYPYQLGHENEEAIKSGAFWFYRKLGFRPGRPELLAITRKEEAKMTRDPTHRTSARTLRQLAAGHVFYEFGDDLPGQWDTFSTRTIGLAVQRRLAEEFTGDPEKLRRVTVEALSQDLQVDLGTWSPLEQSAFANFAAVLSLAPEVAQWTNLQKQALADIIRAKVSADETEYLRLLQQHQALKQLVLRVGSERSTIQAVHV
ncbi:MAG TPA: hypothetical protein VII95_04850 [Terriglobales bacterium]|jgi:hypothetical protein